jgi:hypothetical protein
VTDVNEAPFAPVLSADHVGENQPAGTTVGILAASDPDAGQTVSFSVVTTGCGATYPDGTAFTVVDGTLRTAETLDHESKSTYSVCVRATDDGQPALSTDALVTISVDNGNDAPLAGLDVYDGAIGNTMAALGRPGTPGPVVTLAGSLITANDSDQDADTITAVPETVTSTGGGTATIYADGSFTFLPGVGDHGQTDSFAYHVTDGQAVTAGTVQIGLASELVWWVDNASTATSHDGRSTSPLTSLAAVNGADTATDADADGDIIFVYTGNATYAGGMRLEDNQVLRGERAGLTVGAVALVPPAATSPVLTNATGNGIDLAEATTVSGIDIADASGDGVHGAGIGAASVGVDAPMSVVRSGGDGIELSGAAAGDISIGVDVLSSGLRSLLVTGRTGGTVTVSGDLTGRGVALTSNTGATINLSGTLDLTTTADPAFTATGGGTVTATGSGSDLASTTGGAVIVENTTIGSAGLTFSSVSADGAVNGVRLISTGTTGGLTVLGGGSTAQGGDASGGTIRATSGPGILLTSTKNAAFTNVSVLGVPASAGIQGTGVDGFAFAFGRISGAGLSGGSSASASVAFNGASSGARNVSGTVSITGSVLENALGSGVDISNEAGTISSLTISSNLIQSQTTAATALGNGISIRATGSASTGAVITTGSISSNTIRNFPSGNGISILGGNTASLTGPVPVVGSAAGSKITVTANAISGSSPATPMGGSCIAVQVQGRGTGFVDVTNNGTAAAPIGTNADACIGVVAAGAAALTTSITGNQVAPVAQLGGTPGILGKAEDLVVAGTPLGTARLAATVSNNVVRSATGDGIRLLASGRGTMNATMLANAVSTVGRYGIRVDSGTVSTDDANVCLQISSNTTAGGTDANTGQTFAGIGLRKQGTAAVTNDFGIINLAPSPADAPGTAAFVSNLNPGSAPGSSGSRTDIIAGSSFINCTPV